MHAANSATHPAAPRARAGARRLCHPRQRRRLQGVGPVPWTSPVSSKSPTTHYRAILASSCGHTLAPESRSMSSSISCATSSSITAIQRAITTPASRRFAPARQCSSEPRADKPCRFRSIVCPRSVPTRHRFVGQKTILGFLTYLPSPCDSYEVLAAHRSSRHARRLRCTHVASNAASQSQASHSTCCGNATHRVYITDVSPASAIAGVN